MYSSIPFGFLLSQSEIGLVAEPKREQLQPLWAKANQAYIRLGGPGRSYLTANDVMGTNGLDKGRAEIVIKQIKLYSPHDTHPTGIFNIRLSKLVTPQLLINEKRAEQRAEAKASMSSSQLFDVVVSQPPPAEPVTKQILGMTPDNGAFLFTTDDEDVRPHAPIIRRVPLNEKDQHGPEYESLSFPIGGSFPPFANVYRIKMDGTNSRLIINNGVHRLFSLLSKGNAWCPLIVTDIDPNELPDPFVNFNRDALVNPQSNPPMLSDFLNKDVVIPMGYYPVKNTMKINYTIERYPTVVT
jgi:hypothetical protein